MSNVTRVPTTTDSHRQRLKTPETKLWMEVLQRAIIDAFASPGKDGATVREAVEAQNWLTRGGGDLALPVTRSTSTPALSRLGPPTLSLRVGRGTGI